MPTTLKQSVFPQSPPRGKVSPLSHGEDHMSGRWRFVLVAAVLGLIAAAPLVYSSHQNAHLRNFRVVENGVLYRCGQLTPAGLERVIHDYNIKTVVTLRAARVAGDKSPDEWEESFC